MAETFTALMLHESADVRAVLQRQIAAILVRNDCKNTGVVSAALVAMFEMMLKEAVASVRELDRPVYDDVRVER